MEDYLVIEKYSDFDLASHRAKELALGFKERTGIKRSSGDWAVLVSPTLFSTLTKKTPEVVARITPVSNEIQKNSYEPRYKPGQYPPDLFSQIITKNAYGYRTDCDHSDFYDNGGARAYDPSTGDCNVSIMDEQD